MRPLTPEAALELVDQIADGLHALHEHGIIHRDLKPSNIMLAKRQKGPVRAVLMDFGLARTGDRESDLFDTRTDLNAGAPFFMAPELLRDARPSVASDIYAFGLILDEMVTRKRAFSARSVPALLFSKLCEEPIRPSLRADALPEHWEATILKCLSADPEKRPRSAKEVQEGLRPERPSPATAAVVPVPTAPTAKKKRRSVMLVSLAAAFLALTGVTAAVVVRPITATVEIFDIDNQTNLKQLDYLCAGTTNELMRRLTHVDNLRVIPVHSTRHNVNSGGKSARFALDGLLQAYNGQVRLSMQVTDTERGLVWAENFDREKLDDPLELQSQIAREAVNALQDTVFLGERGRASQFAFLRSLFTWPTQKQVGVSPTVSNRALDLYMRARHLLEELSGESTTAAIDHLRKAVDEDPAFALGWAALATAYIADTDYTDGVQGDLIEKAQRAAEQAVRYDPQLPEARAAYAAVRQLALDWDSAEANYKEALRLKPVFPSARRWYGGMMLQRGRIQEGLSELSRAIDEDPFDRAAPTGYGWYLFLSGHYEEARAVLEKSAAGRDVPGTRNNLGQVYARLALKSTGEERKKFFDMAFTEAATVAAIERKAAPSTKTTVFHALVSDQMYALFYAQAHELRSAEPYLDRLKKAAAAGTLSPAIVAWVQSAEGDLDGAMAMLEQASPSRDRKLLYSKIVPYLAPLHGDPRFEAFLNRMRL
jgi:TolB-like protein